MASLGLPREYPYVFLKIYYSLNLERMIFLGTYLVVRGMGGITMAVIGCKNIAKQSFLGVFGFTKHSIMNLKEKI